MPVKSDIVFPVFLKCLEFCTDPFWENIFEDLVYGKAPYGSYISKGFICCKYKSKEFNYKIEKDKDPQLIYNEVYNLLYNKLNLLSSKDKIKKKVDFYKFEKEIKDNRNKTWTAIRKKNIKDFYIENFVINMKKKFKLKLKQAKELLSFITIGMIFKVILSKDIIFDNCVIEEINGIQFEIGKIHYEKNIYDVDKKYTCIIESKPLLSTEWDKFLKRLEGGKKKK